MAHIYVFNVTCIVCLFVLQKDFEGVAHCIFTLLYDSEYKFKVIEQTMQEVHMLHIIQYTPSNHHDN